MSHDSGSVQDASQLAAHLSPTLALLRAVAAEGHLTRAADQLGIPQPTVSRTLARLADEIGAPVIARQGRGIHLTRAGRLLATAAENALRELESGSRAVIEEVAPERGQIVFGFQHSMGNRFAPLLISTFRAQHPQVRFGLNQGSRKYVVDRMLSGEVDLCLISPVLEPDPRWEAATLREEPVLAVLPDEHRLAGSRGIELGQLADDDFVSVRHGYGLRQILGKLTERAGFSPRITFEGEEVDTVRGLVAAGLGVAVLPPGDAAPAPGTVELPLHPAAHRTIGLVWPGQRDLPPAVRAFRDHALTHRS